MRLKPHPAELAERARAQRPARAEFLRAGQLKQRRANRPPQCRFEIVVAAALQQQALILEPCSGALVDPALHPHAPAPASLRIGNIRAKAEQIAPLLDDPRPVPGLASGERVGPHRRTAALALDLTLRAIEHDFKVVLAKQQLDIGKFVAAIAAIPLECAQHAVAVQFRIPASWHGPAQRGDAKASGAIQRAVRNKYPAPEGTVGSQPAAQRFNIAQRQLRRRERPQHPAILVDPVRFQPQRFRPRAGRAGEPRGIGHPQRFTAGQGFKPQLRRISALPFSVKLHVYRRRAPDPVRCLAARQLGEVQIGIDRPAQSRGATSALDRLQERQVLVRTELDGLVGQVCFQRHPSPGREPRQIDTPALGRIDDRAGGD